MATDASFTTGSGRKIPYTIDYHDGELAIGWSDKNAMCSIYYDPPDTVGQANFQQSLADALMREGAKNPEAPSVYNDPTYASMYASNLKDGAVKDGCMGSSFNNDDGDTMTTIVQANGSSVTTIENVTGNVLSEQDVSDSGSQFLKLYDADNHKVAQEVDVDEDAQGNIDAVNVILNSPVVQAGGTIGEAFGSAIGRAIAGNNQFAQLAAGTVVGAIGKAFGTIVAATPDFDLESMPVDQIFGSFGVNVAGAALGSIASFLTAELGTALHLNGYGAQLFDSAVGSFAGSSDLQIAEDYERYLNNMARSSTH